MSNENSDPNYYSDSNGSRMADTLQSERARRERAEGLNETAWTLLANASGGDWTRESKDWQDAAAAWRDQWIASGHPTPNGNAQAKLDRIGAELNALESASEPNTFGEAVRVVAGRLRGILAVTLLLIALVGCATEPRTATQGSALEYSDAGLAILEDEADMIEFYKATTGCAPPQEFFATAAQLSSATATNPRIVTALDWAIPPGTEPQNPSLEEWTATVKTKCEQWTDSTSGRWTVYCQVCCTTVKRCRWVDGGRFCWDEVRCTTPTCTHEYPPIFE